MNQLTGGAINGSWFHLVRLSQFSWIPKLLDGRTTNRDQSVCTVSGGSAVDLHVPVGKYRRGVEPRYINIIKNQRSP